MDLDATVLIQHDLSARIAATGGLDVTFVELADEDRDASAEFDLLGTCRPPMAPCLDGESVAWRGQVWTDPARSCLF
ncbi:MAG TPA: hypothetical protein VEO01_23250 [Pseudonocardiaceae bacterium]|nr:hypothetical protein [Pseudonocardiaceae bacterium]